MAGARFFAFLCIVTLCIALYACQKEPVEPVEGIETKLLKTPAGFPAIPFPEDNKFSMARWELGKKLFYDPALSLDGSISCASCHKAAYAFADNVSLSPGIENRPGTRNAPSLANVAYQPYYLREGSLPSLEMQALVPIQEHNEFAHNIVDIAAQLKQDPACVEMSKAAYDRSPDPYVITRALATYQRTLVSGNSPYDQYQYQGNAGALSSAEIRGMNLFFSGKTNCSQCHSGFNFTDYSFQNNGNDSINADPGRSRFTRNAQDEGLFKVPSLRNVALTAPYMHNGSINSLEEVIEIYNNGGKHNPQKSPLIKALVLTAREKADLLAFLKALGDPGFTGNKLLQP